jgi:hypothetical protein
MRAVTPPVVRSRMRSLLRAGAIVAFGATVVAIGCSRTGPSTLPTGPTASGSGNGFVAPTGAPGGPSTPVTPSTTTVVVTPDASDPFTVVVGTTTTSDRALDGKIQIQIYVDDTGKPIPCDTPGGTWVRVDQDSNGGEQPNSSGVTTETIDLAHLSSLGLGLSDVACGDSVCFRAHYVSTGNPHNVAETHMSDPASYTVDCAIQAEACSPGFWRQDQHFADWPNPPVPDDLFSSVFGRAITVTLSPTQTVSGPTLEEALLAISGGVNRTARIGTAAYLSAVDADVNYPYTPAQVVTAVQQAIDGVAGSITIDDLEQVWLDNPDHCPL